MPTDLDPVAVLRRTDPATAHPAPEAPSLDELTAIPGVAARSDGAGVDRVAVLAAAIVLVAALLTAAVALVADDPDGPPPPATATPTTESFLPDEVPAPLDLGPGVPAAPQLLALADGAEADTTAVPPGSAAYSRTVDLSTVTTVEDQRTTDISYVSEQTETWIATDDRSHHRRGEGPPLRPDQVVQVDPDLAPLEGELASGVEPHEQGILARPVGPEAVRADLLAEQGGQPAPYAALERFAEVLGRQPLTGADRAALYRALATIEGIEHRGAVVDRAGRRGVAFTYRSDFSGALGELIVIVDPASGALLQVEDVMLESAPAIPIDEPLIQHISVVLSVAPVPAVGIRPG